MVYEYDMSNNWIVKPISLKEANKFINKYHRHNKGIQGYKFAIAVLENNVMIGVGVVGRPVARLLDDGWTAEITRVCTNGTKNLNSFIYSRLVKICKLMGYKKVITYTLAKESGASLKAIGAKLDCICGNNTWNRPNRTRNEQNVYKEIKYRWILWEDKNE